MQAAKKQGRGDGGARVAFLLAWSLAGLCVALFVATFPLSESARSEPVSGRPGANEESRPW